ncbi:MAG: hypothetical protein KKA76_12395, partial [Proteobacteria bacterium]|nr:hypothetical protein [Pseudomonadota bacterium]
NGSKEDTQAFERDIRGDVDRSDPDFTDLLPELKTSYKNKTLSKTSHSLGDNGRRFEYSRSDKKKGIEL